MKIQQACERLNKSQFLSKAGNPTTLRAALIAMSNLRAQGFTVKRQEVKAWFGNNSVSNHNL